MRKARPDWLLRAAFLTAIAAIPPLSMQASATPRADAQMCATQTEALADQRIAACTALLRTGRLRGVPEGIAYALRGLAYLDRGDAPHAIGDLNQAVTLAPDFAPAYQNRGNAWYARGNYGQAMSDYDAAIKLDPDTASPYVNRATLRRDLGNTNGALEDFAKAISLNSREAGAYKGRGELYLREKDYSRAIADFDAALRLSPTAGIYMLRAKAREDAGHLDQALADYRDAERLDPHSISAINAEAGIWRKKGNLDNAIAAYDRALAADDRRAETYKLRAEAYAAKGERKLAMADIGRALKFTWSVDLLKARAQLRLDDGDVAGVVRDTDAILKASPDNAAALALQGVAYARKKDYGHALDALDKAIAADDKDALAFGERGQVYLLKGDNNRALADLSRAISLGTSSPAPYRARAAIYKKAGDTAKALADLDVAIGRDPRPAEPYFERAALRQAKGDLARALTDLNEGLTREPNNVAGLRARAQALMETKAYAKAVDDLDSVIRLNPRDTQGYYLRGLAHEQDGDLNRAIADYKTALERDRNFGDAKRALARAANEEKKAKATQKQDNSRVAAPEETAPPQKLEANIDQVPLPVEARREPRSAKTNAYPEKPARQAKLDDKLKLDQPKPNIVEHKATAVEHKTQINKPQEQTSARDTRLRREREARLHQDRDKAKRKSAADRTPPAGIRYYRAGATDMRNSDYHYVIRRRDTSFSDIWNDR